MAKTEVKMTVVIESGKDKTIIPVTADKTTRNFGYSANCIETV